MTNWPFHSVCWLVTINEKSFHPCHEIMRHDYVVINATVSFFNCYRNIISDAQMASIGLAPLKAAKCDASLYQLRIWPTVKRKKGTGCQYGREHIEIYGSDLISKKFCLKWLSLCTFALVTWAGDIWSSSTASVGTFVLLHSVPHSVLLNIWEHPTSLLFF